MENSYLIWIPSLQRYLRFGEFTTADQKVLSKLSDNNLEFVYTLNEIIEEKLWVYDKSKVVKKFTIIDKYIICAYMRMLCIDTKIPLSLSCPTCGVEFEGTMDLNEVIESNVTSLDKDYRTCLEPDFNYKIWCNIPKIEKEYELVKTLQEQNIEKSSIDNILTYQTLSYIEGLTVGGIPVELNDMTVQDSAKVLNKLPYNVIKYIQDNFINPTFEFLSPPLLSIPCPTEKCNPFTFKLNLMNVNEAIQLLFQESPVEILREIYYLSRFGHMDSTYVEKLTPKERTTMMKFIVEENKARQEQAAQANRNNKMVVGSEHGFDLPESPSEFGFSG